MGTSSHLQALVLTFGFLEYYIHNQFNLLLAFKIIEKSKKHADQEREPQVAAPDFIHPSNISHTRTPWHLSTSQTGV